MAKNKNAISIGEVFDNIREGKYDSNFPDNYEEIGRERRDKRKALTVAQNSLTTRGLSEAAIQAQKAYIETLEKDFESANNEWNSIQATVKEERQTRDAQFKKDAIEAVGLTGHKNADRAFNFAWESDQCTGKNDVFETLCEVTELMK